MSDRSVAAAPATALTAGGDPVVVIDEFQRTGRVRSPSDAVRLIGALVLLVVGYVVAAGFRDGVASVQAGLLDTIASFPKGIRSTLVGVAQLLAVVAPLAILVVLLLRRRFLLLAGMVASAVVASAVVGLVGKVALDGAHPATWQLAAHTESWLAQTSFPNARYLAGLAGVVTVASAWTTRRWRRALWTVVFVVALVRVGTSGILAFDLLFALIAGVAAGAAVLLVLGGPDNSPRAADIAGDMAAIGMPLNRLREVSGRRPTIREYQASTEDGREMHVSVRDEQDRRRDIVYRLYRAIRFRTDGEQHVFTSLRQDAEHEAFMTVWAKRAGLPVPEVTALTAISSGSLLGASTWIEGDRLDTLEADGISDETLRSLWETVAGLHDQGDQPSSRAGGERTR